MKLLLILIACSPYIAFATEQYREVLVVDGYPFEFNQHPLEPFISSKQFIELYKPILCTGAWRGYQGRWALYGNKLYLQNLNLTPCGERSSFADLKKLFPNSENEVEASWVSMDLVVPIGMREYFRNEDGSSSVEFQAVVYKIERGILRERIIQRIKE